MTRVMLYREPDDLVEELLDQALTMIKSSWGVRARILTEVRRESRQAIDGWARLGYETLAQRVHCEPRYCHALLRKMWKVERIIERGELGAGTRGTAYRINLDVMQWRCVPWLNDRETRRLAFRPFFVALDRGAHDGLAPRSDPLAPRSHVTGLATEKRSHHKRQPRDLSAAGVDGHEAPPGAPSPVTCDRGAIPAANTPATPASPSFLELKASTASEQQEEMEFAAQDAIVRAIQAKTRAPCNGPSLLERILKMGCDENSVARALKAVEAAPPNYLPPMVVWFVEEALAGRIPLRGDPTTKAPAVDEGEAWAARQRRLIEITGDEDTLEVLREDLARWEDDRQRTQREAM